MTDLDTLLQPIPGDDPCGEDMVFSAEFDQIREARRFDQPGLEQGDWVIDLKEADWPQVVHLCGVVLRERSKDIRVAAWLAEAWARREGFGGLRDGYRLVEALCRDYWEGLHPRAEDGDAAQRIGNLGWLISQSRQLVVEIPLTRSEAGRYGLAVWDSAVQLANAIKRAPQDASELSRGKVTQDQFDAARRDTPPAFYSELLVDLDGCAQALDSLDQLLQERLGDEGPSFSALREALRNASALATRFAREAGLLVRSDSGAPNASAAGGAGASHTDTANAALRGQAERLEPTMTIPEQSSSVGGQPAGQPAVARGPIQTRDQALHQLREVADFFRRTEPHSPVAYLADKAASWGEMSLHLWLRTVLKNDQGLADLEELLGVPKTGNEG
ncbi:MULTISPECIES: type VI secretion system protein TssA [unclassified Achromobacter]|uniref:type VI secretion system protein TssA n=1 Tax=unclassified Achromobacter TaxID=2626865 RepID=UPI000B51768B|nr:MULTISPECIES: type VI secretion system protein TssA [unclassified Achromobacter]OWT69107.1 type VI secretion protein ImpA [Achromobacter sp. HZ34]OWT70512.1 type VI secretion protein ImpA [Achromobacter sp. HZ28]